jgi:hypothetical protein
MTFARLCVVAALAAVIIPRADAAEPLTVDHALTTECDSPVLLRCPPRTAPAAAAATDPRSALERERRAQQELAPVIIYGDRLLPSTVQQVFEANLGGKSSARDALRNFVGPDGRRCTQANNWVGSTNCTPSANAPPAAGFSSAFTAGKP